jgi:hypothetical protein
MGNFSKTSRNIRLDYTVLHAECQRINGDFVNASIDLNAIISNQDGLLKFGGSKFAFTCRNIGFNNNILSAICRRIDGSEVPASIDLNDRLTNRDGVLVVD